MDYGNSGGDEEYDSRAESISAFLNPPSHVGSLSNQAHPHQQPHHQSHTMFDPLSNYFDPSSSTARSVQNPLSNPNSLLNFDMVWAKTPRSDPNPTDLGGLITSSSSAPSQPFLTNQLGGQQTRAPTFHNIQIPPQADQQQNASRASLSSTSANDQAQPSNNNMVPKPKRTRDSRPPTSLLTTDTTNFRAMVQHFNEIRAPPFTSSPLPSSRLDLFESVGGKNLIGIRRDKRSHQSRKQPEVIEMMSDVEAMQPQATRTLKPQGLVFDVEADQHEAAQLFIQAGLGLTKPPKDEDWENTKEIYLMNNELSILPENPMCPQLSALFLQRNYKLRAIPPSFFDYMPALQILNLSRTGIKSLPDSLIRLVSLKRLFLNYCRCFMVLSPKVGELKQLEVLDLEGTEIMHLPQEIKKLTNLTCLEVSFYGYTSDGGRAMQSNALVPCGVIFALSQLEELNIDLNPDDQWWDAHVEGILSEVCNLKRLNALKFYFPRVELLRYMKWNSPISLSHFRFTVGHHVKRIMSRVPHDVVFELERWERCLKYINGGGDIPREIKKALQHATAFFLDRHATAKSLSNFGTQNMEKLKCCVMGECKEVQVIIDEADAYEEDDDISEIASDSYGTEKIVLGSLEYLYAYRMKSLRSLWNGQLQWKSLFLLKSLTFHTCPQLTTIFVPGFLDKLCKLEELTVKDCPSIRSLVSCEITAEHKTSNFLPNLKRIALHYMPELVSISSGLHIAPKLEWSSFYNCKNLKNPFIEGISSKDLKKIEGEESWWKELKWSNGGQDYYDKIFVSNCPMGLSRPKLVCGL